MKTDKKQAILQASQKLIAHHGFHGLSMHKLAEEAGVAAGTIYRYFTDKEHIIEETRIYVLQCTADIIQKGLRDDMSLKEKYRTIWFNIWHYANTEDAVKTHFLYSQLATHNPAQLERTEKTMFAPINAMFEEGKASGLFKPLNNKILISISLESSAALARKKQNWGYQIDNDSLEQALEASWDALIQHKTGAE